MINLEKAIAELEMAERKTRKNENNIIEPSERLIKLVAQMWLDGASFLQIKKTVKNRNNKKLSFAQIREIVAAVQARLSELQTIEE